MTANVMSVVNELISQQRWDEAYTTLNRYAQQQLNDPQIEYELGVLCFNMGRYGDAEIHLKTSLSIFTDNPDAHYHLGLTFLKEDRPQEAMPEFREACERKGNFAVGHLHWGLALASMGKLSGAVGQFNQAIKLNPTMFSAYYQAAVASFNQGQLVEAVQYFQKACNVAPNLGEAYNGLGVTLAAMGKYEDAVQCFAKAWQVDGSLAVVQRNWASALVQLGQVDEAIRHYQDAVGVTTRMLSAKDRAVTYNDWGVNLFKAHRLDEAAEKLVYAVDVDPGFTGAHLNLGLVRTSLQEFELAAESFDKALQINPNQLDIALNSAITYLMVGRYSESLERLTEIQTKGVKSSELDFWLGYAHLALGNGAAAQEHFEKAVFQNSTNYMALDGLGCCLALNGQHAEALDKFSQCLALNRDYALGHLHLARSLEAVGRADAALLEYREAIARDSKCLLPEKETIEILMRASQFDAVMERSLKLLEISPTDADAKISLAKAMRAQNRNAEALTLMEGVIQADPTNGPALVLTGQIFLSQGRFVEADEQFRVASTVFDGDAVLYYSWGKSLSLLGLHELALEKYAKASEIDPYDADVYDAWGAALKTLGRFGEAAEVFKRASEYM
jgi:tetratricopeptide (TPR) repeat protein